MFIAGIFMIVVLVCSGKLSETRIGESVRRLLKWNWMD